MAINVMLPDITEHPWDRALFVTKNQRMLDGSELQSKEGLQDQEQVPTPAAAHLEEGE